MAKEKEMNPSSQMVFDMAKIFLDIQTSSFESGMKHAKEDAEREQKMQDFADKCERDLEEEANKYGEMSDVDFMVFQDDFYDLLEKYGVHSIDGEHPHFNEICEVRDKVADFIAELLFKQGENQ